MVSEPYATRRILLISGDRVSSERKEGRDSQSPADAASHPRS
jgi:hypothetical protein